MRIPQWNVARVSSTVAIVLLMLVTLFLAWWASEILLLTFAGILYAVFLHGIAKWISKKTSLSHGWSLTLTVALLIVLTVGSFFLLFPEISHQMDELSEQLPRSVQKIRERFEQSKWMKDSLQSISQGEGGKEAMHAASSVVTASLKATAGMVYFVFLGLFLAVEPDAYVKGVLILLPPSKRKRAREVLEAVGRSLSQWLLTRLLLMAVIGVLTYIGLLILKIPMALTLGLLAGILLFVPYVGAIASAVPAVLVAMTDSTQLALYVVGLYLLTHIIEGYILTPIVQKRAMELSPALLLAFQALMEVLAGIPGLALSTPLLAVLVVGVQMLYIEDQLHERPASCQADGDR